MITPEERIAEFLRQSDKRRGTDTEELYTVSTDTKAEPAVLLASDLRTVLAEAKRIRAYQESTSRTYRSEIERLNVWNKAFIADLIAAEADRDRARDAAVALEQENAAARALHAKRDVFEVGPGGTLGQWLSSGCEECSDPDLIADLEAGELTEDLAPWPCPTILALDGGER